MENADRKLTPLDELYLQRAYELAARGLGSTAPNPPAGAVVVREGRIIGEGYHHRAGEAHAEPQALAQAGSNARGATLYVSLEPCMHVGRTPPCAKALIEAGVARVVAGTLDPSEHGGAKQLRERGVEVTVAGDLVARDLIEIFERTTASTRPYVAVKMASSLDGFVTSRPGVRERMSSPQEERCVRQMRTVYDAVMVGAGTVRIDDPMLTVRPSHDRGRPYVRIVACERDTMPPTSRIFESQEGYARTIVLAPTGLGKRLEELREIAEVLEVGAADTTTLDLPQAMRELRKRDIMSVLCEGGPKLAGALLAAALVDRVYWAIAPRFLSREGAVPALAGADIVGLNVRFDRVERLGADVMISGICSAA